MSIRFLPLKRIVLNLNQTNQLKLWILFWRKTWLNALDSFFWPCYVACGAPLIAQLVKNLPAIQETWFDSWVGKIPWRRERLPTPLSWPGEFQGLYSWWGCKETDTTEWLSLLLHGLWDLSSPTKDGTLAVKVQSPNHWTTRDSPVFSLST